MLRYIFILLAIIPQMAHAQEQNVSSPQRLYLHFFAPDTNPIRTQLPHGILTTEIQLTKDIDIRDSMDAEIVSGRIESRGNKFFTKLTGHYGLSTGNFEGEIELEKPFSPSTYTFSGMIQLTCFVLSTNSDCKPFLETFPFEAYRVLPQKVSPTSITATAENIVSYGGGGLIQINSRNIDKQPFTLKVESEKTSPDLLQFQVYLEPKQMGISDFKGATLSVISGRKQIVYVPVEKLNYNQGIRYQFSVAKKHLAKSKFGIKTKREGLPYADDFYFFVLKDFANEK